MKLEKIKLSGFKSFVDNTVIPLNSNLTAIVGPNGCGKSNIIDAVRWVMGESSAKNLRGGSMTDVIFNGSATRKPVNTASVELVFDNSDGKLTGEFAQTPTIAIKRQVSRDGQSLYFLNGARCRRKDITDLFLGTGLGSRSYAIIEQGTISRMVEAKPDELRITIDEAAGLSKYKERRNETEVHIRHTRENLERLQDVRDEVDKQLKHLHKQAEKAEKYTTLKQQEYQFKVELLAMRWNNHAQAAHWLDSQLQDVTNEHSRVVTELQLLQERIEQKRAEHKRQQQLLSAVQDDYYGVSAEINRLEQTIKHAQRSHEDTVLEIARCQEQVQQADEQLNSDRQTLENVKTELVESQEQALLAGERQDELAEAYHEVQREQRAWQAQWEHYRNEAAQHKQQSEVQRVKISQLEQQQRANQNRLARLAQERDDLLESDLREELEQLNELIEQLEEQRENAHQQLASLHSQIKELRQTVKTSHDALHHRRGESHSIKGKITSLELLQQHALGKDNKALNEWLKANNLENKARLAHSLKVSNGWELAVETVLGNYLDALCVDNIENLVPALNNLTNESLALINTTPNELFNTEAKTNEFYPSLTLLIDKVSADCDLRPLLNNIYCAADNDTANAFVAELQAHESIITPTGAWFGASWLKIMANKDNQGGLLQRETQLRALKQRETELILELEQFETQLDTAESQLKQAEFNREHLQQQHNKLSAELSTKTSEYSANSARLEQQQERLQYTIDDIVELESELAEIAENLAELQYSQENAEEINEQLILKREQLETTQQNLQHKHQHSEQALQEARQQLYRLQASIETLKTTENLTLKQIERLQLQKDNSQQRLTQLESKLHDALPSLDEEKQQLLEKLAEKNSLELKLNEQKQAQQAIENDIQSLAEQHSDNQKKIDVLKDSLDKLRFDLQESHIRQQTVTEQLEELQANIEEIIAQLPETAEESSWKHKVDALTQQIEKLGNINLTAIEEYQEQAQRMQFLNEQHTDLMDALRILEQAMAKIDRESRQRFKETFDKINTGLQEKFPKLFGGGQAYLELNSPDILEAGVAIIARPPGKKNSSIHLLSGGEKALTAIALVFSIFELNPAPFCLLDEVDAPLDDTNVGRFSQMVAEMSKSVQFLYISHNKVTMEIAQQLAGVTMKEPGVSRMVAVDIDEAVSLAEH